jgi:Bacterial protein of unknown function (DUF916)
MFYKKLSSTFWRSCIITSAFIVLVFSLFSTVSSSAEIFVRPKNSNEEKALYYKMKAGESLTDSFDISNMNEESTSFVLQSNDIYVTDEGTITLLQNKEENKGLGSWISMLSGAIIIKPNTKVNIPLTLQVPADAKNGEYGAGISVTIKNKDSSNVAVSNTVRKGLKVYILVGDQTPKLSSVMSDLKILNPESSSKNDLEKKRPNWDKNNITFSYKAENQGDIFSVIKGTYTVTYEDGEVKNGNFNTNLASGVGQKEYFVSTGLPYKPGKTTLKVDYQVVALNKDNIGQVENGNIQGGLSDQMDLNSKVISEFRGADKNQNNKSTTQKNEALAKILGVVIIIVSGLVAYKLIRKRYLRVR